jgi:hypothetical protein
MNHTECSSQFIYFKELKSWISYPDLNLGFVRLSTARCGYSAYLRILI